jgi:hypothetical protein
MEDWYSKKSSTWNHSLGTGNSNKLPKERDKMKFYSNPHGKLVIEIILSKLDIVCFSDFI